MKCELCEKSADELMQVVMPKAKDKDTSAFEYALACAACVDKEGLADKVVQTVNAAG